MAMNDKPTNHAVLLPSAASSSSSSQIPHGECISFLVYFVTFEIFPLLKVFVCLFFFLIFGKSSRFCIASKNTPMLEVINWCLGRSEDLWLKDRLPTGFTATPIFICLGRHHEMLRFVALSVSIHCGSFVNLWSGGLSDHKSCSLMTTKSFFIVLCRPFKLTAVCFFCSIHHHSCLIPMKIVSLDFLWIGFFSLSPPDTQWFPL